MGVWIGKFYVKGFVIQEFVARQRFELSSLQGGVPSRVLRKAEF